MGFAQALPAQGAVLLAAGLTTGIGRLHILSSPWLRGAAYTCMLVAARALLRLASRALLLAAMLSRLNALMASGLAVPFLSRVAVPTLGRATLLLNSAATPTLGCLAAPMALGHNMRLHTLRQLRSLAA